MREVLQELLQSCWEIVHGCADGAAEGMREKAKEISFPKSWVLRNSSPFGWVAGFGFGTLAITIGAFSSILAFILNWGKEDR